MWRGVDKKEKVDHQKIFLFPSLIFKKIEKKPKKRPSPNFYSLKISRSWTAHFYIKSSPLKFSGEKRGRGIYATDLIYLLVDNHK